MANINREVFIDGQQVDVNDTSAEGYIFTSPIFRDITKIISNRTTTYKLPRTAHNLKVFGFADNIDVYAEFPYLPHVIEERRDGITFLKGECNLLGILDTDIELYVAWGTSVNMQNLKDVMLRDLTGSDYFVWNSSSKFLHNESTQQYGFVLADFGVGIDNMRYQRPSVTIDYILNTIRDNLNITFKYPERFNNVFSQTWLPLLSANAGPQTWEDSLTAFTFVRSDNHSSIGNYEYLQPVGNGEGYYRGKLIIVGIPQTQGSGYYEFNIAGNVHLQQNLIGKKVALKFVSLGADGLGISDIKYFDIEASESGSSAFINTRIIFPNFDSINVLSPIDMYIANNDGTFYSDLVYDIANPDSPNKVELTGVYIFRAKEVPFGAKYPIVNNFPDLSVVDFLKTIMQMYGLYTYYEYTKGDVVEFLSLEDIYSFKDQAYDFTHKLLNTTKGRTNYTFRYSDYLRDNWFRYDNDETVQTDADGSLVIDNKTLKKSKEVVKLPYSASDNVSDDKDNTFAFIPLYTAEDRGDGVIIYTLNEVKDRVLFQGVYKGGDITKIYKSMSFVNELKFGGTNGLLAQYYGPYQHILNRPVVIECYAYLQDLELATYREIRPIFIDGVYFMPIKVTVQSNGVGVFQLIRMPPMKQK